MSSKNKILIVLDVYEDFRQGPDDFPIEIEKAFRFITDKTQTEIILIGCGFEEYLHESYSSFAKDEVDIRKEYVNKLEARLGTVAKKLQAHGYNVISKIHWAYPRYEQIAQEAEDYGVDLVIQHVNGASQEDRHILSQDSWQLVRNCKRPLLLIRDKAWPSHPILMAAVDPMHSHHKPLQLDDKIMQAALAAKGDLNGELHVIHACSAAAHPFTSPEQIVEKHQQALDAFMSNYELEDGFVHISEDKPVQALVEYKNKLHVDIIVMGVVSKSRLAEALVGNTAEKVVDYMHSDVMVIRP